MSTKELILEKIKVIKDESILEDLLKIIELEIELDKELIYLSAEQKSAINEGLKNIEDGDTFTNKEAYKLVDEWLENR
ncbi:MAG: hypothetical protein DRI54_06800 [Bacteroidetes bacterium]|nr:MAG: hypothetical protein DRI54_06800 [Bacteroidota bacterium]